MGKISERIERSIMYLTITLQTICPIVFYIYEIRAQWSYILSIFIVVTGLMVVLFATLCLCYRGYVELGCFSGIQIPEDSRACNTCSQYKPERSHHCSSCGKCIKKMDHHCHWLGRCINYDNHGFFVKFILSMLLNSSAVAGFNCYYIYTSFWMKQNTLTHLKMAVLVLSTISSLAIGLVSCFHFNNQMNMIIKNVTYIETLSCETYGYSTNESPYDLGLRHNLEEVFGPLKYFLLSRPAGNGIFFKKKYDVNYWPKHFRDTNVLYTQKI